jgi:hypothetical protein
MHFDMRIRSDRSRVPGAGWVVAARDPSGVRLRLSHDRLSVLSLCLESTVFAPSVLSLCPLSSRSVLKPAAISESTNVGTK